MLWTVRGLWTVQGGQSLNWYSIILQLRMHEQQLMFVLE